MFTIIGADGKEYGPVTANRIAEWIAGGRANLQTKARRAGETEWKTLGDYAEFNPAAVPPAVTGAPPPVESGPIPAAAAPAAAPTIWQGTPAEIAAALAPNAANFDLFSCLGRSFELWKSNLLPLVGVTTLILAVQFMANMVPILGVLSSLLLTAVFTGGLYYYYLGKMRGEPRDVGDAFAGFSRAFLPLLLCGLIMQVANMALAAVFFAPLFLALIAAGMTATPDTFQMPAMSGLAIAWMAIGVIPLVYIGVAWVFSQALVIDRGLGPWVALEVSRRVITRRWFSMFFLMICAGILAMLGLIGLGIGVLFTIPLAFGALLYAYEDLCQPPPLT
jgi:hypothetical protein